MPTLGEIAYCTICHGMIMWMDGQWMHRIAQHPTGYPPHAPIPSYTYAPDEAKEIDKSPSEE